MRTLILYAFHLLIARPLLRWVIGVRYRRRGPLPAGPCLVVSNHNSHLDAAVLMTLFPLRRLPRVHPVAAADYFARSWFMRMWAMLFMNGVPIERRPAGGHDPLLPVVERLRGGDSLIFFPEGSRGEAGVVARFRPGVGLLVREVPGLLVVPVFLSGPERIWPRGNVVPVPLGIDAHVGRARSYPADHDPREIAQQVRRDVLELAPPLPPVPGTRPVAPLRVSVCSADAAARRGVFRSVVERLGTWGKTVGLSDAAVEADEAGLREAAGPVAAGPGRVRLRVLAWLLRTSGRFKGERFVELVERIWTEEALGQARDTRCVVADGGPLLELLAWSGVGLGEGGGNGDPFGRLLAYLTGRTTIPLRQWWRVARRAPQVWLINLLDLGHPLAPDVVVHVRVPVVELLQRIRTAGTALEPHENEAFLERLQDAYAGAAELLRRRRRVEVVEVDGAAESPEAAAARVEAACRGLATLRSAGEPGGRP